MRGLIVDLYNRVVDLMVNRLTSARATAIDNLDAAMTTRAPASTAVSNAVLTPTRIGYLDNLASGLLATTINSRQSGYVDGIDAGGWTGTGSGEDLGFIDVPITSVNVSKCDVDWQGSNLNSSGTPTGGTARLTSATNLRISLQDTTAGVGRIRGRWTVLERK